MVVFPLFYLLLQEHQIGLYGKFSYKGEKNHIVQKGEEMTENFTYFGSHLLGGGSSAKIKLEVVRQTKLGCALKEGL